ncbi:bifunctional 3,4-dihydroxy-2-butanone-4-phosphate synthase/GTP cyclohydrolase II [Endozoicomonas elysicola]|uniref:3,4-dihydroxy-2-butanone 4-phosphate synthase n=1 Tax=Endozoicomonas elysicola TaxID=305900 RepID=A0A081K876_9GAMM|nr:bifunctional 3,4-dihydroxy-2-butanone-4-phosphate synthase/GTP cyclohydrolase II [Endozoicomonas elysicola]KEI70352.1 3,4-dihydroxy-2-butanone 4-phosphate synthase [Endozoicomonas elysicola]
MQLNSIEELLEDIRLGKPVILMDDEDRENEGDLIIAAEKITPEIVNFMTREARGLLCLTLTGDRCDFLGLPQMVGASDNQSGYGTPFTVSIEAAEGVTTGISAQDRAKTILTAVDPLSRPEDIVQPGHIFPLRARPGGVLSRAGHTEAGCDLSRLAGLTPAAAIIEIMNEDGSMARRPDLEAFAEKHDLKIGTIADLIHYRILHEKTVDKIEQRVINTDFGQFDLSVYQDSISDCKHLALSKGYITPDSPTLVRVHAMEPFRDLLAAHSEGGRTSWSLHKAMAKVAEEGAGVVVLLDSGSHQDLGMALERFIDNNDRSSSDGMSRAYQAIGTGSQILRDLGVGKMRLLSSPIRFAALSGFDLEVVEYLPFGE